MARGRMVSRTLGSSRRFNALTDIAGPLAEFSQLLFTLLIPHVDDFGRMVGDAFTVRLQVMPGTPRSVDDVGQALTFLHHAHLITVYTIERETWLEVSKFHEHQRGLNHRTESRIQGPPKDARENFSQMGEKIPSRARAEVELRTKNLTKNLELRTDPGSLEDPGNNQQQAKSDLSSADADFATFNAAYPTSRRVGGKTGRQAFKTAMRGKDTTHLERMIEALEQQKRSEQWQTPKLIPLMTTWLNQERWNQVLPEQALYGHSNKTAGNVAALQRFARGGM